MAFLSAYLVKGIIVSGDAASTARNVLAHDTLYRSGFSVGLLATVAYIVVTVLFYRLFEPINRTISLLAASFSLVGCALQFVASLWQIAVSVLLEDSKLLEVFGAGQTQMGAMVCLKLYSQTFNISLVVFALYDLALGYLIIKSRFLPRSIGLILMLAGAGWMTFAWPPLGLALRAAVLPFGALAEIVLMLWLIVKSVDAQSS